MAIGAIVVAVVLVTAVVLMLPKPSEPKLDEPPSAPMNLVAVSGDRTISLSWQPPADIGTMPVKNYRVYRGTAPGILTLLRELDKTLAYTDGGLDNGRPYYYRVSAVNSVGEGTRSAEASATPGAAAGFPSEPRNFAAHPGNTQVTLTWDPPANTSGAPVTAYRLYRGNASGQETFFTETGGSTGYTCTGLVNGQTYYFQVGARNSAGEGPRSAEASATPAGGPSVPSAPRNLTYVPGASNVTLNWEPPAFDGGSMITGYSIYRGTASGALLLLAPIENLTTYADEGLLPGVTFYYQVSAKNALGLGPKTPELVAMPLSKPSAPLDLRATAGLGSVTLAWAPPAQNGGSPVLNYMVYRGTAAGEESFLVMLDAMTAHIDAGLINGTPYYYQVSASNAQGEGQRSSEATATPQSSFDTPSAPQNLNAAGGDGKVDLTWAPPANQGGAPVSKYRVYRDGAFLVEPGLVTAYSDTGLTNGQAYSYEVSASNSIGEGARSAAASATPATLPGAPQSLSAVPSNHNVSLSWQAPASDGGAPVLGYVIFRNGASLASTGVVPSYRDGTVTNGQAYTYKVAAHNRLGQGPFSEDAPATPDLKPIAFSLGASGADTGVDLGTDTAGNVYVAGYFTGTVDFEPGGGVLELTSAGETDIFVAKYDVDGNSLWAFRVGGTGADRPAAILVKAGGNFLLSGYFSLVADFDPGTGTASLASYGGTDAFAGNYGPDGSYFWAVSFGGPGSEAASDISEDAAGNAYITGGFEGTVDFDPGSATAPSTSAGSSDIFVSSLGPSGAYRWHFASGSVMEDAGTAIQAYTNGTLWVAGYFNGSTDFDPGTAANLTNSSGNRDVFLARYSASGGFLWAGAVGGPENETPAAGGLTLDSPGNVYLTGSFEGLCDFLPTNLSANVQSKGGSDAFIAEYDPTGEYRWAYGAGGTESDSGYRVAVDESGNIYWTGLFRGTQVDFDLTLDTKYLDAAGTGGASDIFLAKYQPGGLLVWAYNFGAAVSGDDKASAGLAICIDINGNVVMTGLFFGSVDFDPTAGTRTLTSNGGADIFIVRLDRNGNPA
jgi:hypothetical protein